MNNNNKLTPKFIENGLKASLLFSTATNASPAYGSAEIKDLYDKDFVTEQDFIDNQRPSVSDRNFSETKGCEEDYTSNSNAKINAIRTFNRSNFPKAQQAPKIKP